MAEIEQLVRNRGSVKAKLTSFSKHLNKLQLKIDAGEQLTKAELNALDARIERTRCFIDEFDEIQLNIELKANDLEREYAEREEFEDLFYSEMAKGKTLVEPLHANVETITSTATSIITGAETNSQPVNRVKLPTIALPKFNGNYQQWLEFRDTFVSLIHENNSISDVQKFHYLRASLEGAAAQVIKSIEISSDNYTLAWDTIRERFTNNRLLTHNHVKALFSLEHMQKESAFKIRKLIDDVSKNLRALALLQQPVNEWDTLIVYIISTKLDTNTAREWEQFKVENEIPTLDNLKSFLKSKADLLETLETNYVEKKHTRPQTSTKAFASRVDNCADCKKDHLIYNCAEFLKLGPEQRYNRAKQLKLCINCLRTGHFTKACRLNTCRKCNGKHHTLLHMNSNEESNKVPNKGSNSEISDTQSGDPTEKAAYSVTSRDNEQVLLSTAYVHIWDNNGKIWTVRALLDSGSQSSFISDRMCRQLNLHKVDINFAVTGLNASKSQISYQCEAKIASLHTAFNSSIKFLVIPEIAGNLPNMAIKVKELNIPSNIKLADPSFFKPGPVDILIGADLFWQLLCIGKVRLGNNKPWLQKTKFGWIVAGPIVTKPIATTHCAFNRNAEIQEQLTRFWELEEVQVCNPLTNEEDHCETHYVKNTVRDDRGKFVVKLPLKDSPSTLGDSYETAKNRFFSLERKLAKNPGLRLLYSDFMSEYESLGHMSKQEGKGNAKFSYYIPHHGVMREDSTTTKLRVVFDASATTSSGVSLNQLQMNGPVIQQDLITILLKFRKHLFVIAADIEKMYRQVLIQPEQRSLQRILWRDDPKDEIQIYNLNTVTYGMTSSSFLAIRSLVQLAREFKNDFPVAARVIETDFYVDDLLSGSDTVEEAKQVCKDVTYILEQGGFVLRKFYSNDPSILDHLKGDDSSESRLLHFANNENAKTLGLVWCPDNDNLLYNIKTNNNKTTRITKRSVLSAVAQIFDPLGLLAPCIVVGKILLQKIWLEKLSWDESLPTDLNTIWLNFETELPVLNELRISRHIMCKNVTRTEMHGFCDASEQAYGACVYLRTVNQDNEVFVSLVSAKSKVAPLKTITIPRLELCAALTLSKLTIKVQESLKIRVDDCFLWSDSTIVLCWLKTPPNCLKTFVSNRVAEIQTLTTACQWRHVPSLQNPADLLSRGVMPNKILNLTLWWHGPIWLLKNQAVWPATTLTCTNPPDLRKAAKNNIQAFVVIDEWVPYPFGRFSKLTRIKRASAYVCRFVHNCQNKTDKRSGVLTLDEIQLAFIKLIKMAQMESYPFEINRLAKGKVIKANSRLLNLNPFLDKNNILRVGGRLANSEFSFTKKHPIILDSSHTLTKLIFDHEHLKLKHAGPQLLLATIRERFWPIPGRAIARKTVYKCVECFRFKPKPVQPIMGSLPLERLQAKFPFNITGVDYAGPFLLKDKKGRGCKTCKCYVSLFVCFSTKAIHLELVTNLTKDAFVFALRRFVARRGRPSKIFSDNGTNFVSANTELKQLGEFIKDNSSVLTESFCQEDIDWEFIPPYSPHFGGIWEAGVKSMKHHMKRVIGETRLIYEEFYTLLVQVEAILNSRPLTPLSSEPADLNPLTPAHFLVGRALTSVPDADLAHLPINRLSLYQHVQLMTQHFWERWNKEFISELQVRHKWKQTVSELQQGALVVIKEDNLPPLKWRLGRVESVVRGKDGVGRVAILRTREGQVKRAFSRICPLPVAN